MRDRLDRELSYLRISVTDRCNLRCRYCMPEEGVQFINHQEILTYEEIARLAEIAVSLGVDRIRITGGEPLVRAGLPDLLRRLKSIPGLEYLGLTTNAVLLAEQIEAVKKSGLDGINISIDTLDPNRYQEVTGRNELHRALQGLEAACQAGIETIKVNAVLTADSTPADWLGVAELARNRSIDVRFIEWMPVAGEKRSRGRAAEWLAVLESAFGRLTPLARDIKAGPAELFSLEGFQGRLGLIAALSHAFCAECNRLRLTSTGDLKLCLFYDTGIALKPLLRQGASDDEIARAITAALQYKPAAHQAIHMRREPGTTPPLIRASIGMYQTGG